MHTSEYEITPEQLAAEKKARLAEKRRQYRINQLIKNEPLNLAGHDLGWQENYQASLNEFKTDENFTQYVKNVFQDTNRWGRLMQVEMKRKGLKKLTPDIAKKTEDKIGEWALRGRYLLVSSWIHGAELGRILKWPEDRITGSRKNFSNQAVLQNTRD